MTRKSIGNKKELSMLGLKWNKKVRKRIQRKLKKNPKLISKFEERYGSDSIEKFEDVLCTTGKLSAVAEHFGFTRAYASQWFQQMYKLTFREYKQVRSHELSKSPSYGELLQLNL